jgi:hypothetical protein
MSNALPQLSDAQLIEVGFTAGQIKEVRKYQKMAGHLRNAHQRGLCRRYSDAQRQLFAVAAPKAKKAKARRTSQAPAQDWTADQLKLMIQLYIKYVDAANQEDNREVITEEFLAQYPERNASGIKMVIMQIKRHDSQYDAVGLQSSQLIRELLTEVDAIRFSA